MNLLRKMCDWLGDSRLLRGFHGWASVFWIAMALPSMTLWQNSVPYLVGISVYAVVTGHWAGWGSARTEESQQAALNELREAVCAVQAAVRELHRIDPGGNEGPE